MKPIIIAIMGQDKPGLVDALAKCVYSHNGNWQGSSFARMAGQFTGFVEVHVENEAPLLAAINDIPDLDVMSVASATTEHGPQQTLSVDVMGNDKPGIVQELTHILNQFNLNIVSFDSRCESAPNWGNLMFKATATITVPDEFDQHALQDALEGVANDFVVDIAPTT